METTTESESASSKSGSEPAPEQSRSGADATLALEAVRDSVLHLVAQLPRLPSAVRITAGDVTVEAEWTVSVPGPPTSANLASTNGGPETPADSPVDEPPPANQTVVRSPTVGSFFRAPKPGAPPFVELGDQVIPGQQVGLIESMKLLFPVNAEVGGTVVEILQENGAAVEHGEPLITLQTG